jgi:hypothetical protein
LLFGSVPKDDVNGDGALASARQVAQAELTGQTMSSEQIVGFDQVSLLLSGRRPRALLDRLFPGGEATNGLTSASIAQESGYESQCDSESPIQLLHPVRSGISKMA